MSSSSSSASLSTGGTRIEYDEKRVPVGVLALAHSLKFPVVPLPSLALSPVLYINGVSEPISGSPYILRHLARLSQSQLSVYGDNSNESTLIDYLLDLSKPLSDKRHLGTLAEKLNTHLLTRSYLVGHSLSIADLAAYESILLNTRWPAFQKDAAALSSYPHFFRWINFISGQSLIADSLAAYKAAKDAKAKQLYEQSFSGSFDVDLPGAAIGKVVTRFPPEPSGYLHIGHAKALLINEIIARRYQGKLIVRFDDTNPNKEKAEYEQSIKDDIHTLGVEWDRLTYTSDYFKELEKYAVFLLEKGRAYIDDTPVEQMRKERMDGIESKCRNRSVEENLRLFQLMLLGDEEGLKCCMRAKIDMSANNKTLRDPVLYRCNLTPHHRTGDKFKAYPTYDFAVPIVDSLEGVTHAMRTIEYRDRDEQYQWVLTAAEMKHRPIIREYARLNFKFSVMSKRKLQWFVDQKLVEGWYDPRFPTIQGTMRRGMTVAALREFIKSQGFSIANTFQEWDKIWAFNAQVIDPIAPRFIAVAANNRVPLTLTNINAEQLITAPLHPKNPSIGTKVISRSSLLFLEQADAKTIANGEEITLMNWGNTIIDSIEKSADGTILSMKGRYHAEGDAKKTDKKLTWVGGAEADLVPISLVEFDHLITIEKVEEDTKIEDVVNRNSKVETAAIGEAALRSLKKGDVIQLMRRGFFRVDQACLGPKQPLVLFMIPDGKTKAMSSLGTAVDKAKGSGTVQKNAKKEKAAEKK